MRTLFILTIVIALPTNAAAEIKRAAPKVAAKVRQNDGLAPEQAAKVEANVRALHLPAALAAKARMGTTEARYTLTLDLAAIDNEHFVTLTLFDAEKPIARESFARRNFALFVHETKKACVRLIAKAVSVTLAPNDDEQAATDTPIQD